MKNSIFSLLVILTCIVSKRSFTQEHDTINNKNIELIIESQFYPRLNLNIIEPSLKWRVLFNNNHIFRSNWSIYSYNNKKEILENSGDGVGYVETINQNYNITIGYEYVINKEKLSPYLGFELIAGWGKIEEYGSRTDSLIFISDLNYSSKIPTNKIGLGVFSGIDINIFEDVYIGTEIGIQYIVSHQNRGEYKVEDASSASASSISTPIVANDIKQLGISGIGVIRVGWKF
jgi:hypothetical protein